MKPIAGFLPIAFCGASMCVAQQETPPAFDAVLIQQSSARRSMITRIEGGPGTRDPGRFRVTEMNMTNLVSYASGISYRFIAGPSWMSEHDMI